MGDKQRENWDKLKRQAKVYGPKRTWKSYGNIGLHQLTDYEKQFLKGKWKPKNLRKQQLRERPLRGQPDSRADKASTLQVGTLVNTTIPTGVSAAPGYSCCSNTCCPDRKEVTLDRASGGVVDTKRTLTEGVGLES